MFGQERSLPLIPTITLNEGDELVLIDVYKDNSSTTIYLSRVYYKSGVRAQLIDTAYYSRRLKDLTVEMEIKSLVRENKNQFREKIDINNSKCCVYVLTFEAGEGFAR